MDNVLALVYSSEFNPDSYGELCKVRPDYMLPFAGRYRIIDFTLSNLSNYDISNVILFAGNKMRSTLDHIGNGRSWELNRRHGGLTITPPDFTDTNPSEVTTYYDSMMAFEESNAEYVFITNPMYINKVDISDAKEKMKSSNADALIFTKKTTDENGFYLNRKIIISDENDKPINPGVNLGLNDEFDLFAGSILIKREVFIKVLRYAIEVNNISSILAALFEFPGDINKDFYRIDNQLEIIMDIYSFFDANFKLLDKKYYDKLFYKDGLVYTKSKDEPSTSYTKDSKVKNSLVANGSIIEGEIENSIIFRGVTIKKGAVIKNSIIFQDSVIGEDSIINYVITDKGTQIGKNVKLFGNRTHPYASSKNEVLETRSYE
ncbi:MULTISPECIES: glucose-1-phosphate adenylyltransferase subunit GlgD [Anaerococcus]|uniref:Glucose-1-phosphate adenylyltransferase subunit GlgD n=1 Tax=Anaerococcus nagyae TaxID=1755241 RepID=A0A3E2TIH4_9FIRM|nr:MULTISPECIES: glucose-1-phosphate adenylyltransferase subunit GlgD [Anaerococcus]MDU1828621.1 glucose-1-phosphate adenylyltransferase subunit GlgD [Anaerococcus sp.]MDU1864694.1 glucose-1-phosphate adenylyltransferase subunit GlgD [Anaerococcus sp.]MDU2354357.1 glucose-1-phosphate adenylyltransferase subunit GlgD [Anaerococcus sp.]MDU2565652.1 glucose-1-phosphate adenylyltransferase subunit GlgD [Anaerococcus sp.]MDU3211236.1 glucose-1-phosphate adenylyltransferase subunit GlgD [Anaerococcu